MIEVLRGMNRDLVRMLETDSVLAGSVTRLMSISGVGIILALMGFGNWRRRAVRLAKGCHQLLRLVRR